VIASIKRNRNNFLLIFLFTLLSGAVRKWVIDNKVTDNIIFAIQIVIPFLFIIKNYSESKKVFNYTSFSIYIFYLFFCIINPLNLTVYHGFIGLLLYTNFWFLVLYYITNRFYFRLNSTIKYFLIFIVAEIVLAAIQASLPDSHILNKYVAVEKVGSIATVGSSVRVTGTFSYISGFTSFLIFAFLFIWVLIKKEFVPSITFTLIGIVFYACLITGSRGSLYLYLLFLLALAVAKWRTFSSFFGKLILPVIFMITLIIGTGSFGLQERFDVASRNFQERRDRGKESGEEVGRILGEFDAVFYFKGDNPLFGVGLGSTYQGANALFGTSEAVRAYGFVEGEIERLVLEGGFMVLLLRIVLAYFLVSMLLVPLPLKVYIFFLIVYAFPITFNIYNSIFLALGIIFVDNAYYQDYLKKVIPTRA